MTRINCVPVETLHDKHLLAEYRELPRVFKLAYNANDKDFKQGVDSYRMGAGHVKFFYNKLFYLADRHEKLVREMIDRGFTANIVNVGLSWLDKNVNDKYDNLWNHWQPSEADMAVNQERLNLRMSEMKSKKENK